MASKIITKNDVERELPPLVKIFKQNTPSLVKVNIYGSYNTNKWNPNKRFPSDVDIVLFLSNEFYRRYNRLGVEYPSKDSKLRLKLRDKIDLEIEKNIDSNLTFLFNTSISICTISDLHYLIGKTDNGRKGDIGRNMINGRTIYKTHKIGPISHIRLFNLHRKAVYN